MKRLDSLLRLGRAATWSIRLVLMVISISLMAPIAAQADPDGNCRLDGSWMGYDAFGNAWWMSTANGMNAARGTLILEVPAFDPTVFGLFPDAISGTDLRGAWTKTGDGTYDWTVLGFALDVSRTTQYISRLSGKDTIEDCNVLFVSQVTLEIFAPDADPMVDGPMYVFPFPDHYGYRTLVDLP